MLLKNEYRDDLIAQLRCIPETFLQGTQYTRNSILKDSDLIDRLWADYQKSIEDYDLSETDALYSAIHDILQITHPLDCPMPENENWQAQTCVTLSIKMVSGESARHAQDRLMNLIRSNLTNLPNHEIHILDNSELKLESW